MAFTADEIGELYEAATAPCRERSLRDGAVTIHHSGRRGYRVFARKGRPLLEGFASDILSPERKREVQRAGGRARQAKHGSQFARFTPEQRSAFGRQAALSKHAQGKGYRFTPEDRARSWASRRGAV